MLQGKEISYEVGGKKVLDQVSVTVFPGKITAIAGPNGAGKSTLLKTLSSDIALHSGLILLNGDPIQTYSAQQLATIRAVLPQKNHLSLAFTTREVVLLGRTPHRTSNQENLKIADVVMSETDVFHLKDRIYQTLSGGEQQRVHLARVLAQLSGHHQNPAYLLLDEPTSSLDIAQQHGLLGIVKQRCREEGFGVLAVIHDLNLAAQYADYLLFMKNGKEVAQGPGQMMLRKEIIEHTFSHPVELITPRGAEFPVIYSKTNYPIENESLFDKNINYKLNGKLGY